MSDRRYVLINDDPRLEMNAVIRERDTGEFFAQMKFHDMRGEIARALISFRDIYDGNATRTLFCHGFLPGIVGNYQPSRDSMCRVDSACLRAIYEWRAKYSHPPVDDDADPGDETF